MKLQMITAVLALIISSGLMAAEPAKRTPAAGQPSLGKVNGPIAGVKCSHGLDSFKTGSAAENQGGKANAEKGQ